VQAAGLEGWFSLNVVARYFEYGNQVTEGRYIAPDTADARPELNFAPSKYNIIPNPQVVVGADKDKAGEVLSKFKLWGDTFSDHCVYYLASQARAGFGPPVPRSAASCAPPVRQWRKSMLEIDGLSKSYGPVRALSDVSFRAERGKVTALLGENGAGKSTLVKILSGLIAPTEGVIRLDGEKVDLSTPERAGRSGVAVVQQEISVLPNLSVAENFMLAQPSRWLSRRTAPALCKPYLQRLGLGHVDPATSVGDLTIGERQLVEIARMLAQNARVLVLDEPTAALADSDIVLVHEAVRRLAAEGNIVLYITHRLNELDEICDQAIVMRNGRLADQFATGDATIARVVHAMIGRNLEELYPSAGRRAEAFAKAPAVTLKDAVTAGLAAAVSLDLRPGEV
ncbi:ATP-binding cassette domain-containing protein, partial [Rhizobiaceae sp. 2RAB30]